MNTRIATAAFVVLGALSISAQAPRNVPVEHFSAGSPAMTTTARLTLRPVEIAITQWSTHTEHRELASALIEQGPLAFARLLCNYESAGFIRITGAPDVVIRYAWSIDEPDGNRRIYLATDRPVSLSSASMRRFPDEESLIFVELRVNQEGDGEGKLSDAAQLFVDSGGVMQIGDYNRRPVHLLTVHGERPVE
jgi:hypothetical protein